MSDDPTTCGPNQDITALGRAVGYRGGYGPAGDPIPGAPIERIWVYECRSPCAPDVVTDSAPGPGAVGVVRNG